MATELTPSKRREPVIQFTVFTDNKVGKLNELVQHFTANDIHVLALSQQDSTDHVSVRLIVNYPEVARDSLRLRGYYFYETSVIAVEMGTEQDLKFVTCALVEAEINIHYLYPFLFRPNGKSALAIHLEDDELATSVLSAHGIKTLDQSDIGR